MGNKHVAQGTVWETSIRKGIEGLNLFVTRTPKTGVADEPDLIVYGAGDDQYPLLFWKQMRPAPRGRRLSHRVVVMNYDDFLRLLSWVPVEAFKVLWIQAKSTERLNAPAILRGLMTWVKQHGKVPNA